MSKNEIASIVPALFNDLTDLKWINLSQNQLTSILLLPASTFVGLEKLTKLEMHMNNFNNDKKLALILEPNVEYISFKLEELNEIDSIERCVY